MTYRVALIGPESTGKTTIARYLAARYGGTFCPEYERSYCEALDRDYTYEDVCTIARMQIDRLKRIAQEGEADAPDAADRLYFFDADLIITRTWLEIEYHTVPQWVDDAIHTYPMDVYLLTYPDLDWVPDPVRSNGDDATRLMLYHKYLEQVQALDRPYYIIRHSKEA